MSRILIKERVGNWILMKKWFLEVLFFSFVIRAFLIGLIKKNILGVIIKL